MIVDFISSTCKNGTFSVNHHFCDLKPDYNYEIGVKQIILQLNEKTTNSKICMLSTNLIDRSSSNPNRAISYFSLQYKQNNFIDFSSVAFHPLERLHAHPIFEIKSVFNETKIEITRAIIRAEIRCLASANP